MQLIPKVGVSEEIAGDLLELENKIESFEKEINIKIEEVSKTLFKNFKKEASFQYGRCFRNNRDQLKLLSNA